MAWIDNEVAYDMFPQSLIVDGLNVYMISRQSHKIHHGNDEETESGVNSTCENL